MSQISDATSLASRKSFWKEAGASATFMATLVTAVAIYVIVTANVRQLNVEFFRAPGTIFLLTLNSAFIVSTAISGVMLYLISREEKRLAEEAEEEAVKIEVPTFIVTSPKGSDDVTDNQSGSGATPPNVKKDDVTASLAGSGAAPPNAKKIEVVKTAVVKSLEPVNPSAPVDLLHSAVLPLLFNLKPVMKAWIESAFIFRPEKGDKSERAEDLIERFLALDILFINLFKDYVAELLNLNEEAIKDNVAKLLNLNKEEVAKLLSLNKEEIAILLDLNKEDITKLRSNDYIAKMLYLKKRVKEHKEYIANLLNLNAQEVARLQDFVPEKQIAIPADQSKPTNKLTPNQQNTLFVFLPQFNAEKFKQMYGKLTQAEAPFFKSELIAFLRRFQAVLNMPAPYKEIHPNAGAASLLKDLIPVMNRNDFSSVVRGYFSTLRLGNKAGKISDEELPKTEATFLALQYPFYYSFSEHKGVKGYRDAFRVIALTHTDALINELTHLEDRMTSFEQVFTLFSKHCKNFTTHLDSVRNQLRANPPTPKK